MTPKLEPIHIERLIRTPDSKCAPKDGISVYPDDYIVAMTRLQELGLVQLHPEAAFRRGAPRSTWTKTKQGDVVVLLLLRHFELLTVHAQSWEYE